MNYKSIPTSMIMKTELIAGLYQYEQMEATQSTLTSVKRDGIYSCIVECTIDNSTVQKNIEIKLTSK